MSPAVDYQQYKMQKLKNLDYAAEYIKIALEDSRIENDSQIFLIALREIIEAHGGIDFLSQHTKIPVEKLSRIFSTDKIPDFFTLESVLDSIGFRFPIEVVQQ